MSWSSLGGMPQKSFTCGHCKHLVSSGLGAGAKHPERQIYICSNCHEPTYFREGSQFPDVSTGKDVAHLPQDIKALYDEIRSSVGASCYTGSVLAARKLLMNLGVAQGAKTGESFLSYVEYLADKGFVPPNGKAWIDHIRKKGNEANHEIVLMTKDDSEELIAFIEMLLKFIYEFPNRVPK